MQEVQRILKATVIGTAPMVVFIYLLSYLVGGVPFIEVVEIWVIMILIAANLLFLLNRLIPGGPKKWITLLIIIMAILFIYPSPFRTTDNNLYFYFILGALLLLNLIVHFFRGKPK